MAIMLGLLSVHIFASLSIKINLNCPHSLQLDRNDHLEVLVGACGSKMTYKRKNNCSE